MSDGKTLLATDATGELAARFWPRVDKLGAVPEHNPSLGPCWNWMGAHNTKGYGHLTVRHVNHGAHRVSWLLEHGEPPEGFVCHRCDRPQCVNPAHLFVGSATDNMQDMIQKGRKNPLRGDDAPWSRLSSDQVRLIRERGASGESARSLALEFGVNDATIRLIFHNKNWRIDGAERIRPRKTSRYIGVCRFEGRWLATVGGRRKAQRRFQDEIEAARFRDVMAFTRIGPSARLNFPEQIDELLAAELWRRTEDERRAAEVVRVLEAKLADLLASMSPGARKIFDVQMASSAGEEK